jgi:hypothetical protein|tara:strand:- start:1032 stop:1439 length:408 start_codon:yes stop_codon:yes gene_type:complete
MTGAGLAEKYVICGVKTALMTLMLTADLLIHDTARSDGPPKVHDLSCPRGRESTQTNPNHNLPAGQGAFPPSKFANFRASKSPLWISGILPLSRSIVPCDAHRCITSPPSKQHIEEARHTPGYRKSDPHGRDSGA